ncbi:MAG: hypothetical protein KA278_00525 [Flavobacterium sp.]|nr:hypothetical protein [Flavobacterium sp.]MBP6424184.1 hypothetical protein [Flavobacterium sp.]
MSGTTANLSNNKSQVDSSMDSVVIVLNLETIVGGKTLNTTGFNEEYIKSGHVVVEETSTGALKPLNVSDGAYVALPGGHTYKGIVSATVLTAKPFVSVLVRGSVNKVAAPFTIPAGAITALPLIRFVQD